MNITGFHIEATNICTLKCAGCARTRFIDQWPQHWKNHSLDIDQLLAFLDIDLCGKKICLCGNYGDPIYHPDLINFVQKLKTRGAVLSITTNGSYRKQEWWKELTDQLDTNDHVVFSVDGIPENFTQYRINADWQSIESGMKIVAQATCSSSWKYIPFAFNQTNIDQAKQIAQDLGIKNFYTTPSDRFDEVTQHLMPNSDSLGLSYASQVKWKNSVREPIVDAKCQNGQEHFVSADGFYTPCCYTADHRFYYKNQFGKNKKNYDIREATISEILEKPPVIEFYNNLAQQPVCQYSCPKNAG